MYIQVGSINLSNTTKFNNCMDGFGKFFELTKITISNHVQLDT